VEEVMRMIHLGRESNRQRALWAAKRGGACMTSPVFGVSTTLLLLNLAHEGEVASR
jgi:hypothetical protein